VNPSLDALDVILRDVIAPHAAATDAGAFPDAAIAALGAAGLLGLVTPVAHGGLGQPLPVAAEAVQRVAQVCGSTAMVLCMHLSGATVLAALGSDEVNRDIAAGRHLSTLAFSEASSRSHFWAPSSTATPHGADYLLDARKSWITSASRATAYVWSSLPAEAEGMSTLWLVPRDAPGLSRPAAGFDGLGLRGNDSTPVRADGVRVPRSAMLGADGGGFDLMMGVVLPTFNVLVAACSLGLMEAAVAKTAAHVGATRLSSTGGALADLPTIRAHLARMRIQTDLVHSLWRDTTSALAEDRPDAMLRVLEVKAAAGESALEVAATAMRVCGGAAFRKEVGVERIFRDVQAASVMGPTTDVLWDFIGKAAAGLPLF
jgi:alkylation response protein AidB-like acyl-CoA dehydrogenase